MKKILTLIAVFAILTGYSQECNVTAIGFSYLLPKGAGIEVIKSGKFQVGIGLMYNPTTTKEKNKEGVNYSLDILSYGGVRVYHEEYRTAIYTNIGFIMSDLYGPQLFTSAKLMLLRTKLAYSIEPYYSKKPGLRFTLYKLL